MRKIKDFLQVFYGSRRIVNKLDFKILNNICFSDYIDRITFQKQVWVFNEISSLIKTFYNNYLTIAIVSYTYCYLIFYQMCIIIITLCFTIYNRINYYFN